MNQATFNFAPKGKRADIAGTRLVAAKAPLSSMAPPGVKWYEKQLCTRSPARNPAACSARARRQ